MPELRPRVTFVLSSENRTFCGYQLLVQHIAPLEERLTAFDVAELGVYLREVLILVSSSCWSTYGSRMQLRKGASGARRDDAANMKPAVVSWLTELLGNPVVPLTPNNKSERGFEHDLTGQLLCPMEYDWDDER